MRNLVLASILCACVGFVILVSHVGQLFRYSVESPYVAAFSAFGMACGLVLSMIILLIDNYEQKMASGAHLVVHE